MKNIQGTSNMNGWPQIPLSSVNAASREFYHSCGPFEGHTHPTPSFQDIVHTLGLAGKLGFQPRGCFSCLPKIPSDSKGLGLVLPVPPSSLPPSPLSLSLYLSPSLPLFCPWLTVLVHHQHPDFSDVLPFCWFSVLDPQGEPGRLT